MKAESARKQQQDKSRIKFNHEAYTSKKGGKGDTDFQLMVENIRARVAPPETHKIPDLSRINICVRKRPLLMKEANKGDFDIISCTNPAILVHKCKTKVDGITKYIENSAFEFDNTFSEYESSESLYFSSIQPQIDFLFDGGIVTCFAYGQTGAGKTFTMENVQKLVITDFFAGAEIMKEETGALYTFTVTYYEIYNGKVFDLFDKHKEKKVQESRSKQIKIPGLKEVQAQTAEEMTHLIEYGLSERKTKSTACNDTSSRSHAIGTIHIKRVDSNNRVISDSGKLLLVDLAGSEKAHDSQSNNKSRRTEGAEINTSLLSLKECIRAMESDKYHIPFRRSKLTMVLRDSFMGGLSKSRVIMIACISPNSSSTEHTINTLRYADRLKSSTEGSSKQKETCVNNKGGYNADKYLSNSPEECPQEPQQHSFNFNRTLSYEKDMYLMAHENHKDSIEILDKYKSESNYSSQRMPEEQGKRIINNIHEDSYSYFELNPHSSKDTSHMKQEDFLAVHEDQKYNPATRKSYSHMHFEQAKDQDSDHDLHEAVYGLSKKKRTGYKHNFAQKNNVYSPENDDHQRLGDSAFNQFSSEHSDRKEESEDDIMQVESDHSNEVSKTMVRYSGINRGSYKESNLLLNNSSTSISNQMKHSKSSGKLNHYDNNGSRRGEFQRESFLQSSITNVPQGAYIIRKKPSTRIEPVSSKPQKFKLEIQRKVCIRPPELGVDLDTCEGQEISCTLLRPLGTVEV
ncbi:unnamed protein product [Moneuplotes crassus]|uniref:Kinesin-like protein n=1 Tax=Euplotes crassus TaxID=5936 RepID=A0AAD1XWN5_EUPCR|nr:unnamed protein product [Moneuplotes crassus]